MISAHAQFTAMHMYLHMLSLRPCTCICTCSVYGHVHVHAHMLSYGHVHVSAHAQFTAMYMYMSTCSVYGHASAHAQFTAMYMYLHMLSLWPCTCICTCSVYGHVHVSAHAQFTAMYMYMPTCSVTAMLMYKQGGLVMPTCTSTVSSSTKQNPREVLVALSLMRRTSLSLREITSLMALRTCQEIMQPLSTCIQVYMCMLYTCTLIFSIVMIEVVTTQLHM